MGHLGFQLSRVWVSIQLVSLVSATTQSTCGMTRFTQAKSETGDVLCATSPSPTAVVNMKTKEQCSWVCAHTAAVCAAGFNFRQKETRCEMFVNPPTNLAVPDMTYNVFSGTLNLTQSINRPTWNFNRAANTTRFAHVYAILVLRFCYIFNVHACTQCYIVLHFLALILGICCLGPT